jgi:MATE family multidrug resistance protein
LAELARLAGPVVVTRLGAMAMGLSDTVVVGRYSARELGYMALGWAPTAAVMTAGMGLLAGVQVMTARRIGEGRPEAVGAVLRRGVAYALWTGLLASAVLAALGPAFLSATGVSADLAAGAGRALRVFAWSLTGSLVATAIAAWLEANGEPGRATLAIWLANAVNLGLDLVFVPGGFGVPAMGAVGSGLATLVARVAWVAALVVLALQVPGGRELLRRPARDRAAEAEQRRIGYAAGAAFFVEAGAFSAMNVIAGWVGGLAVAGWAIVLNVTAIVFMVPLGLATAASVLVARAYGAGDWDGVRRAGVTGLAVAGGGAALVSLAVWPGARVVASAYTRDEGLIVATAAALGLACLFFVADALQVVGAQMLRACGDVWVSTAVQIASYALVMLPLAWRLALPAKLGLAGILWAVIAASLMSAGLLVARFFWVSRPAGAQS